MSSSLPEPDHAAVTASVSSVAQGQQVSQDDDHNKSPQRAPARTKSTSLLTQALAAKREAEATALSTQPTRDPTNTSTSPSLNPTAVAQYNDTNTLANSGDSTSEMAMVVTTLAPTAGAALSLGATPASSPMHLNFHDMNDVDSRLQSHRESLTRTRGRGASLEHMDNQRHTPVLPKGSTNSGDTGFSTPHAPPSPDTLSAISTNPPTDGVRARYRSWRDVHPGASAEKAWSIGEQGADDNEGGQVEKSIKDSLAGVEPNNRSRKASHSLRFFKEGLPEDKPKKVDKKARLPKASSHRGKDGSAADTAATHTPPIPEEDGSPEFSKIAGGEGYFDVSKDDPETISEGAIKKLPAQLLAEIRKHHNLTPGASKGSSFSRSIPVTESERKKAVWVEGQSSSPEKLAKPQLSQDSHGEEVELSSPIKSGDEDDSGEEQISSALFVPHKTPHDSPEHERASFNYGSKLARTSLGDPIRSDDSDSNTQEWLEEHEVPSREVESKYFNDEAKPQSQVPSVQVKQPSPILEKKRLQEPRDLSDAEHHRHADESGYVTKGEESSLTDDPDTTPTGSLKRTQQIPKDFSHVHDHQERSKQPLEAIELVPYRHQVGGHTTMWRFSKRAVCKQLNNRENEFYEKVERYHPRLLKFLPRYIGVLNVTFERQQRRKSVRKDGPDPSLEKGQDSSAISGADEQTNGKAPETAATDGQAPTGGGHTRMISQSMQSSSSVPVPTVTFADNRHIIPSSFLQPHPHLIDPQHTSKGDTTHLSSAIRRGQGQSQPPLPESDFTFRPSLSDKHAVSWGATSVNKKLRNQVFGEAFLQNPIPIHRHKTPASKHRSLPLRHGSGLRPSISESSLQMNLQTQATRDQAPEESIRRKALKTAAARRTSGAHEMSMMSPQASLSDMAGDDHPINQEGDTQFNEAGTSAPEQEIARSQGDPKERRPRRYSSGGLRRKPSEVAENRGNLKYYVEADDAGYKGDEEDVFTMDPEPPNKDGAGCAIPKQSKQPLSEIKQENGSDVGPDTSVDSRHGTMLPAALNETPNLLDIPRPVNPTTARTQLDKRVEYFLLLEDLTAGMKKPCIMDLKMGTRQYGVDANEKKQKSQRKKCAETTSKELGVRVCGLQVWDVKTETYIFKDKYFGRSLKVGPEFQDALMRFLYDGVDYSSVLRHIPTILHKLSQLEILIRGLVGYRFYAASLLVFYDGDTQQQEEESDSTAGEKDINEIKKKMKDIDFKIADFANCVTKEGLNINERPCPPRHPDLPDKGFLRGLKSLKNYFLAIQEEIRRKEMAIKGKKEDWENGHDNDFQMIDDEDEGGISY